MVFLFNSDNHFVFSMSPGEGLFQGVGSPQGRPWWNAARHRVDLNGRCHGKFARRTSLTTTWILRPRRSTVLADHDSQVPNVKKKEASQCEFSYVVLRRMINDKFFKMIQDKMSQLMEISQMTFVSNYSVLSETVQRILFPHIFSLFLSGPCSFALQVEHCLWRFFVVVLAAHT